MIDWAILNNKFDVYNFDLVKEFLDIDTYFRKSETELIRGWIERTASERTDEEIEDMKSRGFVFEEAHGTNKAALKKDYSSNKQIMTREEHDAYHAVEKIGAILAGDKERSKDATNRASTMIDAFGHFKYSSDEEYKASLRIRLLKEQKSIINKQILEQENLTKFICLGSSEKDQASFISSGELVRKTSADFIKTVRNQGKNVWRGPDSVITYCTVAYAQKNESTKLKKLLRSEEAIEEAEMTAVTTSTKTTTKTPTTQKLISELLRCKVNLVVFDENGNYLGKALERKKISEIISGELSKRGMKTGVKDDNFDRGIGDAIRVQQGGQLSIPCTDSLGNIVTLVFYVYYETLSVPKSKYKKEDYTSVFATIPLFLKNRII